MKKYRVLQLITGFHKIHHIYYGYGYKLPFIKIAYFKHDGLKKINSAFHNCTLTGVY